MNNRAHGERTTLAYNVILGRYIVASERVINLMISCAGATSINTHTSFAL